MPEIGTAHVDKCDVCFVVWVYYGLLAPLVLAWNIPQRDLDKV
jgi:hypothetical protein